MNVVKNEKRPMSLTVTEGLTVTILPDSNHQFLMPTKEVAKGYGTSDYAIRKAFLRNNAELVEGKHFCKGLDILSNHSPKGIQVQPHQVFWTKRGIVRLGFFIKSERAKLFRNWAEDLIINLTEPAKVPVRAALPTRRNHNRLTQERIIDILADVCRIDDCDLRLSLTAKIMGGQH